MAVATYTKTGSKSSTAATLPKEVFGEKVENHELLKQAYEGYLANGRQNAASTLTRGNVRGGGRKPWRQKGTGRARHGSIRSPIWRGGGVTFGPLGDENYTKNLTKKANRKALRQALSLSTDKISVIDSIESKDGKTSEVAKLLKKIGAERRTLLVVDEKSENLDRATGNIQNVKLVHANYLNVYDIMNADSVIVTKKSLDLIKEWLGGAK